MKMVNGMRVGLLAAVLVVTGVHPNGQAASGGDPEGAVNLAATSKLPKEGGLAAAFPGDHGIATHPAVIFADDFESGKPGERWDETRNKGGKVLDLADPGDGDSRFGKRSLRVTATLGENTGGGMTKWFESAPVLYFRFYVKFDPASDYFHHFVTLRANKGLHGGDRWTGFGKAGIRPKGDGRFSTALEPWGNWGKSPAPGRWNFYSYWHEMKASGDRKFWGNAFRPAAQKNIPKNQWICCEFMLKHNTPGKPDGEQAFWINGRLRGHWMGINWRTSPTLWANALTLESYVTDRWTRNKTNTLFFDNVVFAREYIGPTLTSLKK